MTSRVFVDTCQGEKTTADYLISAGTTVTLVGDSDFTLGRAWNIDSSPAWGKMLPNYPVGDDFDIQFEFKITAGTNPTMWLLTKDGTANPNGLFISCDTGNTVHNVTYAGGMAEYDAFYAKVVLQPVLNIVYKVRLLKRDEKIYYWFKLKSATEWGAPDIVSSLKIVEYGGANGLYTGPGAYSGNFRFSNLKIICGTPKANEFSKVAVIDVGNRRFMCELVYKLKFSDITVGLGTVTNLGTDIDPIIDEYGVNTTPYYSITAGVLANLFKLQDNVIITFDEQRMGDDTSTQATAQYHRLWRDQNDLSYLYLYTDNLGVGQVGGNQVIAFAIGAIPKTVWIPFNLAKFGEDIIIDYIQKNKFAYPEAGAMGQAIVGAYNLRPLWSWNAGVGETTHMQIRNVKFYRVIEEMRP